MGTKFFHSFKPDLSAIKLRKYTFTVGCAMRTQVAEYEQRRMTSAMRNLMALNLITAPLRDSSVYNANPCAANASRSESIL